MPILIALRFPVLNIAPLVRTSVDEEPPAATLRGGTLLHRGFYDLLALIPTPSPLGFAANRWGASANR